MLTWFKSLGAKLIAIIVLGAVVLGLAAFALSQWRSAHTAKTEARLERGLGDAKIESGHDAVETIGNRQAADAAGQEIVRETKDDVAKQVDAGGATDAGRRGLCRLTGNRGKPECLR